MSREAVLASSSRVACQSEMRRLSFSWTSSSRLASWAGISVSPQLGQVVEPESGVRSSVQARQISGAPFVGDEGRD